MNNIEFKDIHTESGIYGNFPFGVKISLAGNVELTKEDMHIIYECAGKIKEMILGRMFVNDQKEIAAGKQESDDILALFDEPIYVEEIPNGYSDSWYSKLRPWFIVTTKRGRIKIGWRKRVISIDWSDSNITAKGQDLFKDEEVTKDDTLIHAYGYEDARRYLQTLLKS